MPHEHPVALTDLAPEALRALVERLGERSFRAGQLLRRAWRSPRTEFAEMKELPEPLREELARELVPRALELAGRLDSADRLTAKLLHRTHDGHEIESVWMTVPRASGRAPRLTACVSTQVGCAFGCVFCASGRGGLVRSLRAAEIAEQAVAPDGSRPTHVVVMGMGEPLANYDEVLAAIRILNAPWGPGIGARRITVSTLGLPDRIERLAGEGLELELAISLHAPNDEVRKRLCPGARCGVREALDAARLYTSRTGRLVTFEYVLVSGVNDSPQCARELAGRLSGMKAKVNLIPLNPVEGTALRPPEEDTVARFLRELSSRGVRATVRRERGSDVNAACGQLRWRRLAPQAGNPQ